MREFDVIKRLDPLAEHFDMDSMWNAFQALAGKCAGYKVSFAVFHSKDNPSDRLTARKPEGFDFSLTSHIDFFEISLARTIYRSDIKGGSRRLSGTIGLHKLENDVWLAFTSDGPDFFFNGLLRLLDCYRPRVARIDLSSEDLRRILEQVEKRTNGNIIVKKAVLYSHQEEGEIDFKKKPLHDVFNAAENQDMYVDKIEYVLYQKNMAVLHAFASRDGILYYNGGDVRNISAYFLKALSDVVSGRVALLSDRERKTGGEAALRPVEIVYRRSVFTSREDNQKLITALSNMQLGGVAVMHRNPYAHAVVLDFYDGSTFDVVVTRPDRLMIVPGFKSSFHSLMRLCEQVFRDFSEGEIQESHLHKYQLSDFMGSTDSA